jgi:gliding motility-associated-like protein
LQEDTPFSGKVSTNDRPSNDGGNVWTVVGVPSHGSVTLNPDGTFVYTPVPNYNGPDSFTYKVCDVNGDCSQALVNLTVDPVNDPPVAIDDYATTPEHKPVSGNVLTNDSDVEKDPVTVTQFKVNGDNSVHYTGIPATIPNVGSIVLGSNGLFTFTPSGYFNGTVPTIAYTISDGKGGTASANLFITVTPVNDPPIAVNDTYPVIEGKEVSDDLIVNDSDPDGDLIRVTTMPVRQPQHGTVTLSPNGQFTYKPYVGYVGPDSFVYELCDNGSPILCSTAVVNLNMTRDVDCDVLVPNSFSPNGDGIHDLFMVRCLYNYDNPEIKIYNRWGNLVFVKEHYGDVNIWGSDVSAWWDGRSNQKWNVTDADLPIGTYYYILKLDGSKVLTGFLYLNR